MPDTGAAAKYCCCVSIWPEQESVTGEPVEIAVRRLHREFAIYISLTIGFAVILCYAAAALYVAHDDFDAALSSLKVLPDEYGNPHGLRRAAGRFMSASIVVAMWVFFYPLIVYYEIISMARSRSWRPAVDAMPEFTYRSPPGSVVGPPEGCSICSKPYGNGDRFLVLPVCRHTFHEHCILYHVGCAFAPRCPVCRTFVRRSPIVGGEEAIGVEEAIGGPMSARDRRRSNWSPEMLFSAIDGFEPAKQGRWRHGIEIALYASQIAAYLLSAAVTFVISARPAKIKINRPMAVDYAVAVFMFLLLSCVATIGVSSYRKGMRVRLWRPVLDAAMPVVRYVPPAPSGPPELCAVCRVALVAGVRMRELPGCSHRAHKGCVGDVLGSGMSPRCPTCRTFLSRTTTPRAAV